MEEDFDYLVTPSVFDVSVSIKSNGWSAERVYGSPGFEVPSAGKIMQMDSSFPSPQERAGWSKGGIVVVKLHNLGSGEKSVTLE